MVKYSTIVDIIEKHITKCSNDEVKAKLSGMTPNEKKEKVLKYLNPAEKEDYEEITGLRHYHEGEIEGIKKHLKLIERRISEAVDDEDKEGWEFEADKYKERLAIHMEKLNRINEEAFKYEKRIFQGHKPRTPKPVNYDLNDYEKIKWNNSPNLERQQINSQEQIRFRPTEVQILKGYFGGHSETLNRKLYLGEELSEKDIKEIKDLSSAIRRTNIDKNIIVYNGGHFNPSSVVGDNINFKGFLSCSYDKEVAEEFSNNEFVYQLLIPQGSHGFTANAEVTDTTNRNYPVLTAYSDEHELLLDKNFKGRIADIDYENHIVTVIPRK